MEFCTLVSEYFYWNTKPITHHIYEWIGNFFILHLGNGTNSYHFKKCSIITKKYQLCCIIEFKELTKIQIH
jgi:hypothetical protein